MTANPTPAIAHFHLGKQGAFIDDKAIVPLHQLKPVKASQPGWPGVAG